jgi:uncharacterized membrane protein YgcG
MISGYIEGKLTALLSQIEALTHIANTDIWLLAQRRPATPILVVIRWNDRRHQSECADGEESRL